MINIEAFGHFLGFTATANFATTLYKEMQPIIFSVITDFKVEDLYEEKKMCEENHRFFLELNSDSEKEMSEGEQIKSQLTKIDLERMKLNAQEAELRINDFLREIKSDAFKDNFEKKLRPLFPLAGTYSVIVLLIAAFSNAYHSENNLSINTLIFVNFVTTILISINIWGFKKSVSVNSRNAYLNLYLVAFSLVSTIFAFIITNNKWYISSLGKWSAGIVLTWSLILSGIAAIGLLWKCVKVNNFARKRIKDFKGVNAVYDKAVRQLLGKQVIALTWFEKLINVIRSNWFHKKSISTNEN